MKKICVYFIVLTISFIYSYETLQYFAQHLDSEKTTYQIEIDFEEEEQETKESFEKDGFSFYHLQGHHNEFTQGNCLLHTLRKNQSHSFSNADYSLDIFSPPEPLI